MVANDNKGTAPKTTKVKHFRWNSNGAHFYRGNRPLKTPANDNFDIVLADPPWSYGDSGTKVSGAAANHYDLMQDADLMRMPVGDLLAPRGLAFCWATSSTVERSIACLKAWGLVYRGIAFVWVKTRKDGSPMGARGIRPSIVKPLTELVLVGSRVATGRPLPIADESVCQTVFAPCAEHSVKPSEVYRNIERLYPDAKRLELFARNTRRGWTSWGNQVGSV